MGWRQWGQRFFAMFYEIYLKWKKFSKKLKKSLPSTNFPANSGPSTMGFWIHMLVSPVLPFLKILFSHWIFTVFILISRVFFLLFRICPDHTRMVFQWWRRFRWGWIGTRKFIISDESQCWGWYQTISNSS